MELIKFMESGETLSFKPQVNSGGYRLRGVPRSSQYLDKNTTPGSNSVDDPFPILWKGSIQSVSETVNLSGDYEASSRHNLSIDTPNGDNGAKAPLIQTLNNEQTCDRTDLMSHQCPKNCNGGNQLTPVLVHNTPKTYTNTQKPTNTFNYHHTSDTNGSILNVNNLESENSKQLPASEPRELYLNCKNIDSQFGGVGSSPGGVGSSPGGVGSSPGGVGSSPGGVGSSPGGVGSSPGSTVHHRDSNQILIQGLESTPDLGEESPTSTISSDEGGAAIGPHISGNSAGEETDTSNPDGILVADGYEDQSELRGDAETSNPQIHKASKLKDALTSLSAMSSPWSSPVRAVSARKYARIQENNDNLTIKDELLFCSPFRRRRLKTTNKIEISSDELKTLYLERLEYEGNYFKYEDSDDDDICTCPACLKSYESLYTEYLDKNQNVSSSQDRYCSIM